MAVQRGENLFGRMFSEGGVRAAGRFCLCVRLNIKCLKWSCPASHRSARGGGNPSKAFSQLNHLALAISPLRTSFRHYSITSLALSLSLSVEIPVSSQTDVCPFEVLVPRLIDGGVSCVHDSILPYYKGILGDSSP